MGRAGSGRAGGSRSSGSRSGGSRSSGSHRISSSRSSSRAGSSSSRSSFGSSSFGGFSSAPRHSSPPRHTPSPHRHHHYSHSHRHYYHSQPSTVYTSSRSSSSPVLLVAFMIIVALFCFLKIVTVMAMSFAPAGSSTIQRYKLESNYSYDNNCIIDEIGWFDNVANTSGRLQDFYTETGVQPYIVLKDYDPSLKNDAAKEAYAEKYFEEQSFNENGFLFMYFAEENVDGDVGLMCYVNGLQATSVMDSEAVEIFWNYVDRYWYTDMSTDDMFVEIFDDTASVIMRVSTTGNDIILWLVILVVVVVGGTIIIRVIKLRNKRKAEEAAEAERILSAPLDKLSEEDELTKKYSDS